MKKHVVNNIKVNINCFQRFLSKHCLFYFQNTLEFCFIHERNGTEKEKEKFIINHRFLFIFDNVKHDIDRNSNASSW